MTEAQAPPIAHDLVGHEDAVRQITAAFASGRMPHAWMLCGIEGIGKSSLAWHAASHVLSSGRNALGKKAGNDQTARLMQAEAHPDMLVVRRAIDEKTGELRNVITVDDALKVGTFLRKTASHGGWRVVIVDEAHYLNRFGENAILKILEEPPPRVLIMITVTTPGALFPTIRSRCRVLQLAPLANDQMQSILTRVAPQLPPVDMQRLIAISDGSPGFAAKIAQTESLPLYAELESMLLGLPALDVPRLHKLADRVSRKSDLESFEVLRELLLGRLRAGALDAARAAAPASGRLRLLDKVAGVFSAAENANLDRKLALIQVVGDIRDARL